MSELTVPLTRYRCVCGGVPVRSATVSPTVLAASPGQAAVQYAAVVRAAGFTLPDMLFVFVGDNKQTHTVRINTASMEVINAAL
jgi:hypothetical protein